MSRKISPIPDGDVSTVLISEGRFGTQGFLRRCDGPSGEWPTVPQSTSTFNELERHAKGSESHPYSTPKRSVVFFLSRSS